jgi:short-subunit dehydrogenase
MGSDETCQVVTRVTENMEPCTVFANNKGYLSYGPFVLIDWNEIVPFMKLAYFMLPTSRTTHFPPVAVTSINSLGRVV